MKEDLIQWEWEQSHPLAYQGTSKLGTILMVWESVPEPFGRDGWKVIAIPYGESAPLPHKKFINAIEGWDKALEGARVWGEAKLYPLWEKKQESPLDWVQGAAKKVKGWWTDLVDAIDLTWD